MDGRDEFIGEQVTVTEHSDPTICGISGVVSAYLLQDKFDVTLLEATDRLGGHTHSVTVQDAEFGDLNIDMGFIVFNLLGLIFIKPSTLSE